MNDLTSKKQNKGLYFLAILPPPFLEEQIKGFKLEMKQRFKAMHALKLPSHITLLIPFKMLEEEESALEVALKAVAQGQKRFRIELDGFDRFSPGVIFVKIADHSHLKELHNSILQNLKAIVPMIETIKADYIHPHINIASRDLRQEDFKLAWREFKGRKYKADFVAKKLFLFKHNGRSWDIFRDFSFHP